MHFQQREHRLGIDFLFPALLFFLFSAVSLCVVILAASVYERTVRSADRGYELNTAMEYVSEKIRQSDEAGAISAGVFDGCDSLILRQAYGGQTYTTYIYAYDGTLRELFLKDGASAPASAGTELIEASDFQAHILSETLLQIQFTSKNGEQRNTILSPRCHLTVPEGGEPLE